MYVTERFLDGFVKVQGEHPASIYGGIWYPQANGFLNSITIFVPFLPKKEKSLIERKMQYIQDRTECFDDYFP
jgi:hypothetical protein